jgi:hypothetical protein
VKRRRAPEGLKDRLSERYLGVAGIHGIGLIRAGRVLRVYCNPGESAERRTVLERLKSEAQPLEVEVIAKPPPRIG